MSEHRKGERRKVMTFTPVYDLDTNILLGYLGDLTLYGALLVGEKPIEINRDMTLAIEFRETSQTPATRMKIRAHISWSRQEENKTNYNTGLEFLELTDLNKKVIESVLAKYQFHRELPL